MLIRDIMIDQPIYVSPDASLSEVVAVMTDKGIGFMIVADQKKALGVLTEGDLVRMAALGMDMASEQAVNHMHAPVFSVQADANVFHAYDELVLRKMRHLVVEDDVGELVGVVTMSSFIANLGVEHFSELQTVSDILHPVQKTVFPDTPVTDAIQLMHECKHAIIALDDGKVVGILTSRGIARLCRQPVEGWEQMSISDVMRPPVTIHRKAFVPEASILMKNNRTRHVVVTGDRGELMGLVTISDVAHSMEGRYVEFMRTVMRDMESDLLTAGSQNRALFERNPNAVFSLDAHGVVTHVNPSGILMTGIGSEQLIGTRIADLYHADCQQEGEQAFLSALGGEAQSIHVRINGHDRTLIHLFMSFVPIMVEGNISGAYAVAFDITERVLAEMRLHKLSQALQQAGEPIAITDSYGVIEFANLKMHQLFAYDDGSLVGMTLPSLEYANDEPSIYREQVWNSVQEGVPYKGDIVHRSKTGKMLDLRLSCAPVHVPGAEKVDYFVNIYEDMSLRREREQHALQSQKMETIGTLAGGIAHDFNNYLGMMSGSLYMLERECADMPATLERLHKLQHITDRSAALVSQLMTFSRKEKLMKETVSCSTLLEETKEMCLLLISRKVAIQWQVAKHVYIEGNFSQLQQVLLNLVNNACDAIRDVEHPKISVELSTVEVHPSLAQRSGLQRGSDVAMLTVSDNGCGIPEEHQGAIFDPFFTTKDVGKGTGMGLAMVYGAIQSHQGWIECSSNEHSGTEFRIYLPLASMQEEEESSVMDNDVPKVLLVDDEPIMLEVGAEILEVLGFQVDACENGEDAVNLFREHPEHYAVAVLDVMMPRQSGTETAVMLRKMKPDFPILFATGYDKKAVSDQLLTQPNIRLIRKPWKVDDLEAILRDLLHLE